MEKLRAAYDWISEPSRRFVPLFLLYLWILTTLSGKIPKHGIESLLRATAWADYQLIRIFTEGVRLSGVIITLDGFAVEIITECTGLFESVILVSAVLAYKATWREKLLGILMGTGTLYLMNILRIAFLLIVGRHAPDFFEFAHVYFWQTLLVLFITAIWLTWIHFFVHDEKAPPLHP